jgi:hypothetical protein
MSRYSRLKLEQAVPMIQDKKAAWSRIAEMSAQQAGKLDDLTPRGAPKTPAEELELVAKLVWNDLQLQALLLVVEPDCRRKAYDDIRPRLGFQPRTFTEVMAL